MKNKLSVRINTTAQTTGGTRGLAAYTLLSAAASDVDNKKHKKDPFDERYIQLCLSKFVQPEQSGEKQDKHHSAVDDVADNLHVRVELIKNMKQSLVKQTATAIKSAQSQAANSKRSIQKQNTHNSRSNAESEHDAIHTSSGTFFRPEVYAKYSQLISGHAGHAEKLEDLQAQLSHQNPNTRSDTELCHSISKEAAMPSFDSMVSRLFPGSSPLHVNMDSLLQQTDAKPQYQPQQISSQIGLTPHHSVLEISSNTARAPLAPSAGGTWFEQLQLVMEEHGVDSAKWEVWVEEEDECLAHDAQITLPSYIQAPPTAVPPPATAVPPAITNAQQTGDQRPAVADQHASSCDQSGRQPCDRSVSQPCDMNTDEASTSEHRHCVAHLNPCNHAESLLDQETLPSACDSMRAITANESGRAVGFGPDQHPASGDLCLSQQLVEEEQSADHGQHVMISHGREASAAALDSQLALKVGSSSISKTPDDRLSSGGCPIVDVQDTDMLGMNIEAHQQHQEDYKATDMADPHAEACKLDLPSTMAAAGPQITETAPHAEVRESPQDLAELPTAMTDCAKEEGTAQQPALGTDCIDAALTPESPHANNPVALHPAVVQQAQPKLKVPIFRRRTHALPVSIDPKARTHLGQWLDSASPEDSVGARPTSHDAVEDMIEEEDFEKDDQGSGMDHPSADGRASHSQGGTHRIPGIAPILNRRRAAPTAPPHPHSPPALGPIPFRTASTSALGPILGSSTLHRDSVLLPRDSCIRGPEQEEEEEGELEGRSGNVGAAANQSTRNSPAAAAFGADQDDPIDPIEDDEEPHISHAAQDTQQHFQLRKKQRQQTKCRRRGLQMHKEEVWLTPDFGPSNLDSIQQGALVGAQLGQKLCYRPVFDVETLLHPPPDPFNLNPPAPSKRRHRGKAASDEAGERHVGQDGGAHVIPVNMDMFSRSLLTDTDLVDLKLKRQAMSLGYQPDQVVQPGEQSVTQHDEFDFAGLTLDDDWDPMQCYTTTTTTTTATTTAAAAASPMCHTTNTPPPASRAAPPQHDHSCSPTHAAARGTTATPLPEGCSAQPHYRGPAAAAAVTDCTRLVTAQAGGRPIHQVCRNGDTAPTDNLPRQQNQQQQQDLQCDHHKQLLHGSWQQAQEPRSALAPVSGDSSPGCTLMFDIDSDSDHLPESAPVTQQWRQNFELDGSQPKMPRENQQQQQQARFHNRQQTSEPVYRHGFAISEWSTGGQLECDNTSEAEKFAKQARQKQQQQQQQLSMSQPMSESFEAQAATDASEGCRLVFDIDSDPEDLSQQPLQQVTWQPTGVSHGMSGDSWPPDPCRVSMSQHESWLASQQPLGSVDVLNAEDISHCYHPQGSSLVSHQAQYDPPGFQHHSQFPHPSLIAQNPQTPNTTLCLPSPGQQLGASKNTAGAGLQHSSPDGQVSPPAQYGVPMQDEVTNGYHPPPAAEQLALWAAAVREDDSCPLVFEDEEEGLGIVQEEEEELDCAQGQSGQASFVIPEGVHPYPNSDPMLLSHLHPQPHPHPDPHPQGSRQQSLHGMTLHSPSWSEPKQPQHEHDSCPLIFLSETGQEQHIMAGAEHTTEQADLGPGKGQFQHSPQRAANSPAQPSPRDMLCDTVRSAQQRDHMAAHMRGHMAGGVCIMYQHQSQHSTDPHAGYMCEAGGHMAPCDDADMTAPESRIHSWHRNQGPEVTCGGGTKHCAEGQVSHGQSPMDLLSHNDDMPAGSQSAEAHCPIVFQIPDGADHAEEEEQAMQLWQEEVEEEMGLEPPAEHGAGNEGGLEGLGTAGDSPPLQDAMRKKTRLRDQLFQDLMKKALEQTADRAVGLQPLVTRLSKAVQHMSMQPAGGHMTLASLRSICQSGADPALQASTQKYFLALLILAQQTNTGQQGISAANPADARNNTYHVDTPLMTLKGSTDGTRLSDDAVVPASLQVVLSG